MLVSSIFSKSCRHFSFGRKDLQKTEDTSMGNQKNRKVNGRMKKDERTNNGRMKNYEGTNNGRMKNDERIFHLAFDLSVLLITYAGIFHLF
jgi:hypothetical protein